MPTSEEPSDRNWRALRRRYVSLYLTWGTLMLAIAGGIGAAGGGIYAAILGVGLGAILLSVFGLTFYRRLRSRYGHR